MIAYVYWHDEVSTYKQTTINIATLAGTMFGQVMFGFLADRFGRKKMYGVELVVLIGSTLGVVMCSTGVHNSMNVYAWLIWWRIMVGVGVGADYPLSAVITSEYDDGPLSIWSLANRRRFAPTKHRARMLASVFFMQPLGQISGNVVSLIVISVTRHQGNPDLAHAVDIMWRWVIGIGVIPGVLAIIFRFAIPETPRFQIDIEDDPIKAEFDASQLFGEPTRETELGPVAWADSITASNASQASQSTTGETADSPDWTIGGTAPPTLNSKWTLSRADIKKYFWEEGNWRTLFATSFSWLLLDFGFYGIGLSSPQFLAKTWGTLNITGPSPVWKTNDDPDANIYTMFLHTSVQALVILNIGSFAGVLLLILFGNRLNRVSLQKYGFLFLAALFIALGTVFITVHEEGALAIVLIAIGQLGFNFGPFIFSRPIPPSLMTFLGPNSTTYQLPAEIFPTRYRGSCYGISAASGKLGSVLVQVFSLYYKFGSSSPGAESTKRYGTILIIFSAAMILGAVVTHFWIPDVQETNKGTLWSGKPKTLEVLALGRMGTRSHSVARGRPFRTLDEF